MYLTNQNTPRNSHMFERSSWNSFPNFSNMNTNFNLESILNFAPLDATVQKHVSNVYTQLTVCFGLALAGALMTLNRVMNVSFELATILTLVSFFAVMFGSQNHRRPALYGYTFFQGITLGYFTDFIGKDVIVHSLLGTMAVFLCFTVAALSAPSRSFLYLGGILASATSILLWNNLLGSFLGYQSITLEIYGGLVVFCGYVVFDTQMMIAKAESGIKDVEGDCLNLWIDLVNLFVRIARVLKEKDEKKKRK